MKTRIVAIALTLTILTGMVAFSPTATASPDFIRAVSHTVVPGTLSGLWNPGGTATLRISVAFPTTVTTDNLANVVLTLSSAAGSSFRHPSGQMSITVPITTSDISSGTGFFDLPVVSLGGSRLMFSLSQPHLPGNELSEHDMVISQAVPPPERPPLEIPPETPPPTFGQPRLGITGEIPRLRAGTRGSIQFRLVNESGHTLTNMHAQVTGSDGIFLPTTIGGITMSIGTMLTGAANARNITIPVEVVRDAEDGYHTVTLAFSMTNPAGDAVTFNREISVLIINPDAEEETGRPMLSLASATVNTNTPGPDGLITLSLTVANVGDGVATNARISLGGFSSSTIMLNETVVTRVLGNLNPGARITVSYSLRIAEALEAGVHSLDVDLRYRLPGGDEETTSDEAHINIVRPADLGNVVALTGVSQNTARPGASNIIDVTFTVENRAETTAHDVRIGLRELSATNFTLADSFRDIELGSLSPGQTATTTIAIHAAQTMPNGNHPLTVMTRSSNLGNEETVVFISLNRPEEEDNDNGNNIEPGVPRVIINRHALSVANVNAGVPFELTITLLNTSRDRNVGNMTVTFSDAEGVFIPIAGVNSFYIASLPAGETTDVVIALMAGQDTETRPHPISVRLDYEDEQNRPFNVTESLSIPVQQPLRLEIMNLNFADNFRGSADLSFQFVNMGRSSLFNLNVRLEGELMASEGDYFVGTFTAGQSDFYDDMIFSFAGFGELNGTIVFEFEDAAGVAHEIRHEISTWINEPFDQGGFEIWPPDGMWPGEGEGENEGFSLWLIIAIAGGVLVIGVVTTIIIVKKRKIRKMELEDYE